MKNARKVRKPVADPDLELRAGPGFVSLALFFLLSFLLLLPKIRGGGKSRAPRSLP